MAKFQKYPNDQPKVREVLALVNKARKAAGLKVLRSMPKGRQGDAVNCPLARALNFECCVGGVSVTIRGRRDVAEKFAAGFGSPAPEYCSAILPIKLSQFARLFDKSRYPELIEKGV